MRDAPSTRTSTRSAAPSGHQTRERHTGFDVGLAGVDESLELRQRHPRILRWGRQGRVRINLDDQIPADRLMEPPAFFGQQPIEADPGSVRRRYKIEKRRRLSGAP